MVFSSLIFIWVFLPIVFILDRIFARNRNVQNLLLLAASLLFYAWGQPACLWLLLVSILANFLAGLALEAVLPRSKNAGRLVLAAGILLNLGLLGYYKYFNFFANTLNKVLGRQALALREIVLPLGISFFTFQALTYLIDLYKGKFPAQRNILYMALYFSFFPRLTQGPIERYRDFVPQLKERRISLELTGSGIRRFLYGLAKKVILADTLGACVDRIYGLEMGDVTGALAWIAIVFYSLQLYYDFSGYSDMAVGLGRMFGFQLSENFNYPYLASSVTDFWRRWHMSLTAWFREYLYFPLGGSRKGRLRTYVNIFIVFMATGLWHGASWDFICWGLFHGFFQVMERLWLGKLLEKTKVLKHVYTILVLLVGWTFFRVGDVGLSMGYIARMFLPWRYTSSGYALQELVGGRTLAVFAAAVLGCGLIQRLGEKLSEKLAVRTGGVPAGFRNSTLELIFCMFLFFCSIMLMMSSTYSAFIYMNF